MKCENISVNISGKKNLWIDNKMDLNNNNFKKNPDVQIIKVRP